MNETYLAYGVLIAASLLVLPFICAAMVGYNPTSETGSGKIKQIYFTGFGVLLALAFLSGVIFSITWAVVTVLK